MPAQDIIAEVKTALRISSTTTAFDATEITPLIEACKLDLKIAGVNNRDIADPCIRRAIVMYCKANFGYRDDSEKYAAAYQKFKEALSLSGDYNEVQTEVR